MNLGLGTVQFGMKYGEGKKELYKDYSEIEKILMEASSNRVKYLDTSPLYGDSESRIGRILANNRCCSSFKLISKVEIIPESVEQSIRTSVARSIEVLGTRLYGLLVHNQKVLEIPGVLDKTEAVFESLRNEGAFKKCGVSVYDSVEVFGYYENSAFDIIQLPINALDQRMVSSGAIGFLESKNVEIHARSLFLQGILLGRSVKPLLEKCQNFSNGLKKFLGEKELKREACLRRALGVLSLLPRSSVGIVGVDSLEHFRQILFAAMEKSNDSNYGIYAVESDLIDPRKWLGV